jgi:hypothetical protein
VRISRRARRLDQEYVAAANVLIDLKVELAVRKTFRIRFAHVTTELATNFFRQLGIRITRKDLDAAGCAHDLIADCQFPIANLTNAAELNKSEIDNRKSTINLAGAGGFEPTNAGSKDRCLTTWLRPRILFAVFKRA